MGHDLGVGRHAGPQDGECSAACTTRQGLPSVAGGTVLRPHSSTKHNALALYSLHLVCVCRVPQSPSNPLLRLCDIAAIAKLTHAAGGIVCVDSSWLSPVVARPFQLGADLVMHSASKYIGGHSGTATSTA